MEALYLLIPLSVIAVFGIIWVLWRAIDGGQFEDLDGPAHAILLDDDRPRPFARPGAGEPGSADQAGSLGSRALTDQSGGASDPI